MKTASKIVLVTVCNYTKPPFGYQAWSRLFLVLGGWPRHVVPTVVLKVIIEIHHSNVFVKFLARLEKLEAGWSLVPSSPASFHPF